MIVLILLLHFLMLFKDFSFHFIIIIPIHLGFLLIHLIKDYFSKSNFELLNPQSDFLILNFLFQLFQAFCVILKKNYYHWIFYLFTL